MLFNKKKQVKQTTLKPNLKHNHKIFSHRKMKSSTLLQKKPQILLMKWNNFLEKYHHLKQLNDINGSLISIGTHLRKKKQDPQIHDVPFIESQQISINEHDEQEESFIAQEDNNHIILPNQLKAAIKTKSSMYQQTLEGSRVFKSKSSQKGSKITLSIKIQQSEMPKQNQKQLQKSQNFTDQENDFIQQEKKTLIESQLSCSDPSEIEKPKKIIEACEEQVAQEIPQEMIKTACFSSVSFTQKSNPPSIFYKANNQQNVDVSNHLVTSKKIDVLIKAQTDQQKRRQRARQIIKEDQQYLRKLMSKR